MFWKPTSASRSSKVFQPKYEISHPKSTPTMTSSHEETINNTAALQGAIGAQLAADDSSSAYSDSSCSDDESSEIVQTKPTVTNLADRYRYGKSISLSSLQNSLPPTAAARMYQRLDTRYIYEEIGGLDRLRDMFNLVLRVLFRRSRLVAVRDRQNRAARRPVRTLARREDDRRADLERRSRRHARAVALQVVVLSVSRGFEDGRALQGARLQRLDEAQFPRRQRGRTRRPRGVHEHGTCRSSRNSSRSTSAARRPGRPRRSRGRRTPSRPP
jgi:hypothetical protein